MNLDKTNVQRVIYGLLDYLGDCGGFIEAEIFFCFLLIFLFTFQPINKHLVKQLFKFDRNYEDHNMSFNSVGNEFLQKLNIGWISTIKLTFV